MRALLDTLEASYLKWQIDNILRVNLFEKLFAKALRQQATEKAMKKTTSTFSATTCSQKSGCATNRLTDAAR